MTNNNFSFNLKHIRKSKGLTQQQLGKLMKKNYTTIGKWENGIRVPIMEDLLKLADVLQVDIKDLIDKKIIEDYKNNYDNKFYYKDMETGLSVEIIPPNNINWNNLSKENKEQYINQAMDTLYEAKKNIKKK